MVLSGRTPGRRLGLWPRIQIRFALSDNALRLYEWSKEPKNTSGDRGKQREDSTKTRLRKTYSDLEDHLREIRLKAEPSIQWEKKYDCGRNQLRVWF